MPPHINPALRVFVDETGDRGTGRGSSEFFVMGAVMMPLRTDQASKSTHENWCGELDKPLGTTLHWRDNLQKHHQRMFVTQELARLSVGLTFVVVNKRALERGSHLRSSPEAMYLYASRFLLERISWYARSNGTRARITFGTVKGFKRDKLDGYLALLASMDTEIAWQCIDPNVQMLAASACRGVQFADIAVGALDSAIRVKLHNVEPAYLMNLATRVYRRPYGELESYGMKVVGAGTFWPTFDWWSRFDEAVP